jgi:hypothetical protein
MKYFLLIVFIFLLTLNSIGQEFDTQIPIQRGDRPAQYILGGDDILLINVNLWGHVQRPGIYSIPSAYGLIDLISSAGGPAQTARLSDIRIIRKNQQVVKVDVEKYIKTGNSDLLPPLQPGDTIIVSGSVYDIFTSIIGIARDLAIIANVFVLASRLK